MSGLSQAIRQKRFKVTKDKEVFFVFDSPTGSQFRVAVDNCSLSGIGGYLKGQLPKSEGLEPGEIMPSAKIVVGDKEIFLGRTVLRTVKQGEKEVYLGMSTVDKKLPIDGALSHYVDYDPHSGVAPWGFEISPEKFNLANFVEAEQSNVDLLARCNQFAILFNEWKKAPQYLYHNVRTASKGVRFNLQRRRKQTRNDYIVMGSNDYLGMASHPKVLDAAKQAIDKYGLGSTGSPVVSGLTDIHEELAEIIARMLKKEKALLFNTGFTANLGAMAALTSEQDLVVADLISHASLHDGLNTCKATTRYFKHNSIEHLDRTLEKFRGEAAGALVVTEGVFSMDGDLCSLPGIVKTKKQHNARLYIDEAHSLGVVGENGLGICEKHDMFNDVDIIMGTLSKSFGSIGAFVASSKEVIDWIHHFSRPFIFSSYFPPAAAAGALAAIKLFLDDKEIFRSLKNNIRHFVEGARNLGFKLDPNHESGIIPIVIGDEAKVGLMNQVLLEAGVFVPPIVYPAVSRNASRFRFTIMATHTQSDLDYALNSLEKAMEKANFVPAQLEDGKKESADENGIRLVAKQQKSA
ncbi:MAG: aminotransferase class I/II-fold pyridoxal phosphate-dependent enzyme [Oligoflexales bacterium]